MVVAIDERCVNLGETDTQRDSVSIMSVTIQGSAGTESLNATLRMRCSPPHISPGSPCCLLPPSCSQPASFCLVSLLCLFHSAHYYRALFSLCFSCTRLEGVILRGGPPAPAHCSARNAHLYMWRESLLSITGNIQRSTDARESRALRPRSDILYKDNLLVE